MPEIEQWNKMKTDFSAGWNISWMDLSFPAPENNTEILARLIIPFSNFFFLLRRLALLHDRGMLGNIHQG